MSTVNKSEKLHLINQDQFEQMRQSNTTDFSVSSDVQKKKIRNPKYKKNFQLFNLFDYIVTKPSKSMAKRVHRKKESSRDKDKVFKRRKTRMNKLKKKTRLKKSILRSREKRRILNIRQIVDSIHEPDGSVHDMVNDITMQINNLSLGKQSSELQPNIKSEVEQEMKAQIEEQLQPKFWPQLPVQLRQHLLPKLEEQLQPQFGHFGPVLQPKLEPQLKPESKLQLQTQPESSFKHIHSRKFRPYCDNFTTPLLKQLIEKLLRDLNRFQKRAHEQNEIKARAKKRFVLGFREAQNFININKVKLLIMATDCEECSENGGLDDTIAKMKIQCQALGIPYAFAVPRRELSYILSKKASISCCAILDYDGARDTFQDLIMELKEAKTLYKESSMQM